MVTKNESKFLLRYDFILWWKVFIFAPIFGNKIWNVFHVGNSGNSQILFLPLIFLRIYEQIRFIYLWTIIDLLSQISFTVKQVVKALVVLNLVFKYILIFGLIFCNTSWLRFTNKGNICIHVKLECENSNPARC